ncbi:MAG TPA: ATP-grasp domain-containing protein [Flavobacteriaceae bacterium]|nr:ATP-grasp domain-containing protein [Flavobacteriaceae bacterium]
MFLIDYPYVSDFLKDTLKKNHYPIVATKQAKELLKDDSLNWVSEKETVNLFKENTNKYIYSNSENVISWVEKNLSFTNLPKHIKIFKNKLKLRELLEDVYPTYFFKGVKTKDLKKVDSATLKYPLIVKPVIGFFSLGVHKVNNESEWAPIVEKINSELKEIEKFYPPEVLNTNNFIIEECIEGEEFAIDCYYNAQGEAVIVNIMKHQFASENDFSDRLYSTSKDIVLNNLELFQNLVDTIGEKTALKNFPIHMEVRVTNEGVAIPIEINPMRFGGWCTTGDVAWFAHKINVYEYFMEQQKPNWEEVFKNDKNTTYSLILLDNTTGHETSEIASFNYEKLAEDFENPLEIRQINPDKFPVFGFLITATSADNKKELTNILNSNLSEYITLK